MARSQRTWLVALVLVLGIVGAVVVGRYLQGQRGRNIDNVVKRLGPSAAPITMEVYSDFQCPACKHVEPVIKGLQKQFPSELQVVFRHFPLENNHRWALMAAQFAECAHEQGNFWAFHDLIYEEQEKWSIAKDPAVSFVQFARDLKLDLQALKACVTDNSRIKTIRGERAMGEARGVRSTPTVFINDETVVGGPQLSEKGEQTIRDELAKLAPKQVAP
jgi:protein-disulfide isomerase